MANPDPTARRITELLDRVARLHISERRDSTLNPAQIAALAYLSRANRFSRMPSSVAEYLATTRGTVSQTLKALARKGLVTEHPAPNDRRARRYDLTRQGHTALSELTAQHDPALSKGEPSELATIEAGLHTLLEAMLRSRDLRSFGLCRTCRHHRQDGGGPFCSLLNLPLTPEEPAQICHEHEAA